VSGLPTPVARLTKLPMTVSRPVTVVKTICPCLLNPARQGLREAAWG
jgi:hypothetical protein